MSIDTLPKLEEQEMLTLSAGPTWDSFEQFRTTGPKQLQDQLGPATIGRLKVKGQEYVIMRSQTFNRLFGLAQEVRRLSRGLLLVRQAVQLVLHTDGARIAIEHLRDLTLQLPSLRTERLTPRELTFDADEREDESATLEGEQDFELDPAKVARPAFTGPEWATMAGIDVAALEQRLAPLSHGTAAITILQEALRQLGRGERQVFLNQHLLRAPIQWDEVRTSAQRR